MPKCLWFLYRNRDTAIAYQATLSAYHLQSVLIRHFVSFIERNRSVRKIQIFNITNGDNITFPGLWPTLARHFGMAMGEPEPQCLVDIMPTKAHIWEGIAKEHVLRDIPYDKLVGPSWQFADFNFAAGKKPAPVVVSTIKLRQAGFQDCIDTEDMLIELLTQYQDERILPR